MLTTTKVISLHNVCCLSKEILCTTIWSQIVIVAIILRNLNVKLVWSRHVELILKIVTFILQLLVTVDVPDPMLNAKSLQVSDESKYTRNRTCENIHIVYYYLSTYVIIYDTRSLYYSLINVHNYKLFYIFLKLPAT